MGGATQLATSNFISMAIVFLLILSITYLFIKRAVEKNDGDPALEAKEGNRGTFLRKMTFKFLYSALMACLFGLVNQSTIGAIIFFVLAFMIGLLIPERTRQPKSFKPTLVSVIFLIILLVLTGVWTASVLIKIGAWLILLIIYLLEKVEKTYFFSDDSNNHHL